MDNYYLKLNCLNICKNYTETLKIIFTSSILIGANKYFLNEFNFIHVTILTINTFLIFVICFFLIVVQNIQYELSNNKVITEGLKSFLILISEKNNYFIYISLCVLYISMLIVIFRL